LFLVRTFASKLQTGRELNRSNGGELGSLTTTAPPTTHQNRVSVACRVERRVRPNALLPARLELDSVDVLRVVRPPDTRAEFTAE
jgi:hypothetical protein